MNYIDSEGNMEEPESFPYNISMVPKIREMSLSGGFARFEMPEFKLHGALLGGCFSQNFHEVVLPDSEFLRCNLHGAYFQNANLAGATFEGSNLLRANFEDCNLKRSSFKDACTDHAIFQNANLEGADLRGVSLHYANLQNANLKLADLRDCDFRRADLRGASFEKANLEGAFFRDAKLDETTSFRKANLAWVCFRNHLSKPEDLNKEMYEGAVLDNHINAWDPLVPNKDPIVLRWSQNSSEFRTYVRKYRDGIDEVSSKIGRPKKMRSDLEILFMDHLFDKALGQKYFIGLAFLDFLYTIFEFNIVRNLVAPPIERDKIPNSPMRLSLEMLNDSKLNKFIELKNNMGEVEYGAEELDSDRAPKCRNYITGLKLKPGYAELMEDVDYNFMLQGLPSAIVNTKNAEMSVSWKKAIEHGFSLESITDEENRR